MHSTIDQQAWEKTLANLRGRVDEESYATWLGPARLDRVEGGTVTLSVPNAHSRTWLQTNFREKIVRALKDVTSHEFDLDFSVRMETDNPTSVYDGAAPVALPTPQPAMADSGFRSSFLNPKYSFDMFVVGESNRFAHAACRQVSDPVSKSYNPLFIYGGVGLGKTHLMHAIGHELRTGLQGARVLYMTSEQFMNTFVEAIGEGKQMDFRDRYRSVDLLMIDDVQFFAGKERTQTEFFHTFNALYDAGKKIVVSSDRPPKELTSLEDRLRNRFQWGLVVDVMPPDLETRIAILKRKAALDGVDLPNDVGEYIANRVQANIRELEGVFVRLQAYTHLHQQPITLGLAENILGHLLEQEPARRVSIDDIIDIVCGYFELTKADLIGTSRLKKFATPRHIAQYLSRRLTSLSFPDIAQKFGGRDHTSVMHAVKKIEEQLKSDEIMRNLVTYLTKRVNGPKGETGTA